MTHRERDDLDWSHTLAHYRITTAMGAGGMGEVYRATDTKLGRNPFRDLPFRAIPLYEGRPWFLPLAGRWYRLRDSIQ